MKNFNTHTLMFTLNKKKIHLIFHYITYFCAYLGPGERDYLSSWPDDEVVSHLILWNRAREQTIQHLRFILRIFLTDSLGCVKKLFKFTLRCAIVIK